MESEDYHLIRHYLQMAEGHEHSPRTRLAKRVLASFTAEQIREAKKEGIERRMKVHSENLKKCEEDLACLCAEEAGEDPVSQ